MEVWFSLVRFGLVWECSRQEAAVRWHSRDLFDMSGRESSCVDDKSCPMTRLVFLVFLGLSLLLLVGSESADGFKERTCGLDDRTCMPPGRERWDVAITVYSYDRPRHLLALLKDIDREAKSTGLSVLVHVIDDNSLDCVYPAQDDNVYDSPQRRNDDDVREFFKVQKRGKFAGKTKVKSRI